MSHAVARTKTDASPMAFDHLRLDDTGDRGQDQHAERPARHLARGAQADAAEAEVRAVAEADAPPKVEQHQGLRNHAEGGGAGENGDHCRGELAGGAFTVRVGSEEQGEHQQAGDRDNVIEYGHPGERSERLTGVEHLAQQRVQPVEEHLGKAPIREGDGEGQLVRGEVQPDEPGNGRGEQRGRDRRRSEDEEGNRQELVDVGGAAVGVQAGANDLRHEHGGQDAAGNDDVDRIRELVGQAERVGTVAERTDHRGQDDQFHEAEDSGDDRPGGEQGARAADPPGVGGASHAHPLRLW